MKIKKNKFAIQISCGLGNQMFQYAFAKAFEYKTGFKVDFDISIYEEHQKLVVNDKNETKDGVVIQKFLLDLFDLKMNFINKDESKRMQEQQRIKLPGEIRKWLHLPKYVSNVVNQEYYSKYQPELFDRKDDTYFIGFFQNEAYFREISDKIKQDFTFREFEENDKFNTQILSLINNAQNSVMIHVRRGDYVKLGWNIDINYYKEAIKYVESKVDNPTFFVFGQTDNDYIKEMFSESNCKYYVIDDTNAINKQDWKDLKLMSLCKHAIIANSTFSWWGAYLNEYEGKIVTAPTPWLLEKDEIIPERWHKINLNK